MGTKRKYWKSQEQLLETPEFIEAQSKEFSEDLPMEQFLGSNDLEATSTSRRDFLKFFGFSVAAATLAACEAPVVKSIPYVNKPEDVTPGVANWYASTYYDGTDFGSVLVKQREGRPIHIKGNKYFGINNGAINARISSSVLSLYDSERLRNPLKAGQDTSWSVLDSEVSSKLKAVDATGKKVVLLTNSIISPSTSKVVDGFAKQFENFDHVTFDSISAAAIRLANEESFGSAFIPSYDFSKAKTILSFSADFLSTWLLANVNVSQYAKSRNPENAWMSKHYQVEADLSLTGSNADVRVPVTPTEEYQAVLYVYNQLAKKSGVSTVSSNEAKLSANAKSKLDKAIADLLVSKNESLVVAGSNNKDVQVLVNGINTLLDSYNTTIDTSKPVYVKQGLDHKIVELVKDMNAGKVGALLVSGVNPSYNLPIASEFNTGLSKVDLKVSFALYNDETASQFDYVAPDNHYLESWNDLQPVAGEYSLVQPIIRSLYDTRQFQDTLLAWSGSTVSYYDLLKNNWSETLVSNQSEYTSSTDFWNYSVHNGSASLKVDVEAVNVSENKADFNASASALNAIKSSGIEVVVYAKTGLGDGSHANNPWLQELPDPISKVTWDNYIAMNRTDMEAQGFNVDYDQEKPLSLATITVNNHSVTLPVYPSYGQKSGTVSVAMGYGRGANGEKVGNAAFVTKEYGGFEYDENGNRVPVGKNVIPFIQFNGKTFVTNASNATIEATGGVYKIASTQIHHTIMDRDSVVRETTFEIYDANRDNKEAYNPAHTLSVWNKDAKDGEGAFEDKAIKEVDLWDAHPVENVGHRWGMTIDLSSCIGCGSCVTSCHSENNVPVVGKDEIRRVRDMHWLRIDRYFSSDMNTEKAKEEGLGAIDKYHQMEVPSVEDTLEVTFQPMMCQHCNHAPCETVCPVAATTHSNEGLNQMTYNRCIGTRYCANNCPYKVRRFNWFNYRGYKKFSEVNPAQDEVGRMVLNPDVVVRARGVMEKCSLCVQRIQAGKLEAKKAGEAVQDGSVQSACAEACPTNAITFGDLNDKKSHNGQGSLVRQKAFANRSYLMLEEVGTQPNIYYMTNVRNKEGGEVAVAHHAEAHSTEEHKTEKH